MLSAAKVVAQKIFEKKASNNGRAPWGFASSLLKQGREIYPKMSMRTINNYIKKLENGSECGRIILVDNSSSNQLSSITNPIEDATTAESTSDSESIMESIAGNESNAESSDIDDDNIKKTNLGGRPKGSTASYAMDERKRYKEATVEAVQEFKTMKAKVIKKKDGERCTYTNYFKLHGEI